MPKPFKGYAFYEWQIGPLVFQWPRWERFWNYQKTWKPVWVDRMWGYKRGWYPDIP